ncbi:fasciclin domain-containing protein [Rhabdaerophilum sp. SD176]|uniref:fasciclin domain-containing protein n=1 Tax=Rhabdaerophilum sp. SD176 TaxID=2983548 RepID=UPI0024E005B2|nr:fasciclin domain-containing protein [Rhabdaerophilum sp. SD176]
MATTTLAGLVGASGPGFDAHPDNFNILASALDAAGLTGALADPQARLTVFAPTDAAFIALARSLGAKVAEGDEKAAFDAIVSALTGLGGGDPIPLLRDILLYHVAGGEKSLGEVKAAKEVATLSGQILTPVGNSLVDKDPDLKDPSFIGGATDLLASNGIAHAIDRVLLPVDVPQATSDPTIADLVAASGGNFDRNSADFDLLLRALDTAGLVSTFQDKTADFTVFAPTDAAFIRLAQTLGAPVRDGDEAGAFSAIVNTLTALDPGGNPLPLLTKILTYHVAEGGRSKNELVEGVEVRTLAGETLIARPNHLIDKDPEVKNPGYVPGLGDLVTQNGIVQAIDGVLLPFDVAEAIRAPDIRFDFDGDAAQLVRLYQAAFGRAPDQQGFTHNEALLRGDMTLKDMAAAFLVSKEFEARFGRNTSDEQFIDALYNNVLDRSADQGGLLEWDDRLDSGAWDRPEVLIGFSESPENQARTADLLTFF